MGGATATLLKGRGSLQDIDQMALFRPHVKWQGTISCLRLLDCFIVVVVVVVVVD